MRSDIDRGQDLQLSAERSATSDDKTLRWEEGRTGVAMFDDSTLPCALLVHVQGDSR
jgi:hypothetical protein